MAHWTTTSILYSTSSRGRSRSRSIGWRLWRSWWTVLHRKSSSIIIHHYYFDLTVRGVGSRQERTEGKKVSLTFCTQKTLGLFCFYFALFCPCRKIKKVDGSSQSVKGTGSFLCFNILITFTQAGPWVNANANAFVRLLWLRWIIGFLFLLTDRKSFVAERRINWIIESLCWITM